MLDPSLGKTLADLGGWSLFLFHIAIDAFGLLRGWWAPGPFYQEKAQALKDALELVDELRAENKAQGKTIERLTVQLARERRRRGTDRAGT